MKSDPTKYIGGNPKPSITGHKLVRHFRLGDAEIKVLNGVDVRLEAGELVSVRGQSGSGKSTLLHVLSALDSFDSGELFWGEKAVAKLSRVAASRLRARIIGLVFQQSHLVPEISTLANVMLAGHIAGLTSDLRKRATSLLTRLGLEERVHHPVQKLSGGERQRVAIARALVNRPPFLLADEPTGNLDEETASEVFDLFMEVVREQGTGVLLVTHSQTLASRCNRGYLLEHGVLNPVS